MVSKKSLGSQSNKEPSDILYVRIGSELQGEVEKAAESVNQTKTAWVIEVLKKATQPPPGGGEDKQELLSNSIRYLLDHPDTLDDLVGAVNDHLKSQKPTEIFKFIGAVEKLVAAIDVVLEFLQGDDRRPALDNLLKEVLNRLIFPLDPLDPLRLTDPLVSTLQKTEPTLTK